jgi:hypothetical protein
MHVLRPSIQQGKLCQRQSAADLQDGSCSGRLPPHLPRCLPACLQQAAAPDTSQHASSLLLFLDAALKQVEQERQAGCQPFVLC